MTPQRRVTVAMHSAGRGAGGTIKTITQEDKMLITKVDNSQDIIDSRDVIARIEELEDDEGRDNDEQEELDALKALADEASDYAADWQYGEALIRDTYFKKYAQDLAEDIGAIDANASWPNTCIDWDQAVRELQMDYTMVEFDGVDYWIR